MDTYYEHNPINPINQKELPERTELEEAEDYNFELKNANTRLLNDLKELATIEESIMMFGYLDSKQLKTKNRILTKYMK